nr:hypothetical protein [Candidatus Delongbacteria bacterium]
MAMLKKFTIIIVVCLFTAAILYAQEKPVRTTEPLSKWERRFGKITLNDKIYQTGSNWFTAGMGPGYSTTLEEQQLNMAVAYHFRYKPIY